MIGIKAKVSKRTPNYQGNAYTFMKLDNENFDVKPGLLYEIKVDDNPVFYKLPKLKLGQSRLYTFAFFSRERTTKIKSLYKCRIFEYKPVITKENLNDFIIWKNKIIKKYLCEEKQ